MLLSAGSLTVATKHRGNLRAAPSLLSLPDFGQAWPHVGYPHAPKVRAESSSASSENLAFFGGFLGSGCGDFWVPPFGSWWHACRRCFGIVWRNCLETLKNDL